MLQININTVSSPSHAQYARAKDSMCICQFLPQHVCTNGHWWTRTYTIVAEIIFRTSTKISGTGLAEHGTL